MARAQSVFLLPSEVVAQYIAPRDFRFHFRTVDFSVPVGCVLLVFKRRELVESRSPGTHQWPTGLRSSLGGLLFGTSPEIQGWLVRTTPMQTGPMAMENLFSKDNVRYKASLALSFQVTDALTLVTTLGWGKEEVTAKEVASLTSPHVEAVLEAYVKGASARELPADAQNVSAEFVLQDAVRDVLQARGIALLGVAQPLRLFAPEREAAERGTADVQRQEQEAALLEEKARVYRRLQTIILQMTQDQVLNKQQLEEVRRAADKGQVLRQVEWEGFLRGLELTKKQDVFQKQAAAEVARLESDYTLRLARLRLEGNYNEESQGLLRRQKEAELHWRIKEAQLEEEARTARLEAEESRRTHVLLEEQRRQMEAQRMQAEARSLQEESRRQRDAAEAAFRREQQLEAERARQEQERLQEMHVLEQERMRAQQAQDLRQRSQESEAERRVQTLRKILEIVKESGLEIEEALPFAVIASPPEEAERILQMFKYLASRRLSDGKIALLEGRRDEFITWVNQHYGALSNALAAAGPSVRTVDDVIRVVDQFLGGGSRAKGRSVLAIPDWPSLVERLRPSVMLLHTPTSFGTGFVVKAGDHPVVVTSAHVLGELRNEQTGQWNQEPSTWTCVGYIGERAVPLGLQLWLIDRDLAILSPLEPMSITPLEVASNGPAPGQRIGILGFPRSMLQPIRKAMPRFNEGMANPPWTGVLPVDLLHITAPVNPGNSGGPVIDGQGQVLGVVSGEVDGSQGMSLAVPAAVLAQALEMTPPLLEQPSEWAHFRALNGILGFYLKGAWQVSLPRSSQAPVRVVNTQANVEVQAVVASAAVEGDLLDPGLAALGRPFPADAMLEIMPLVDGPYWAEHLLRGPDGDKLVLLRWDRGAGRGVAALVQPMANPSQDWQDKGLAMARLLYLA